MNTEISQQEKDQFLNALLSNDTQKLFDIVSQQLGYKKLNERWFTDSELSRRCHFQGRRLETAKSELSRSGLMTVIPGLIQTKFVLNDEGPQ
jgi:hypothetical protein